MFNQVARQNVKRVLAVFLAVILLGSLSPVYALELSEGSSEPAVQDEENDGQTTETVTYRENKEQKDTFSLAVGEKTYYFSDFESLENAAVDENLTGNMTLTVLGDVTGTCTKEKLFLKAETLTVDLHGQTLTLESGTDGISSFSFAAASVILKSDGNSAEKGKLTLKKLQIAQTNFSEISNVEINLELDESVSDSGYAVLTGALDVKMTGVNITTNKGIAISFWGDATLENCIIKNTSDAGRGLDLGKGLGTYEVSGGEIDAGENGYAIYFSGNQITLTVNGGKYTGNIYSNSRYGNLVIKAGYFSGKFMFGKTANKYKPSINIEGGYFETDPVETKNSWAAFVAHCTRETLQTGDYTGWTHYTLRDTVSGEVELKLPVTGSAGLNNTVGSVTLYKGETENYIVTCKEGYYVSKVLSGQQELNYITEGQQTSFDFVVPDSAFALTITVSATQATEETAVAKINNDLYATVSQGLLNLKSGETLILLQNTTVTDQIEFKVDNSVLDLNEKTLTVNLKNNKNGYKYNYGIAVENDNLTIRNGTIDFYAHSAGLKLSGSTSLTLCDAELKNIAGDRTDVSMIDLNGQASVTVNSGKIEGRISNTGSTGSITVNGGEIYAAGMNRIAIQSSSGSLKITGGTICSDISASTGDGAVYVWPGSGFTFRMTGGKIISKSGVPALYVPKGTTEGSFDISGTSDIESVDNVAMFIGAGTQGEKNNAIYKISDSTKLKGTSFAVELVEEIPETGTVYNVMPKIEISGGYFACDEGGLPISDTQYVTFPEGKVLNTKTETSGDYAGYYTLADKASLGGIYTPKEGTQAEKKEYTYQDFDGDSDGSGSGLHQLMDKVKDIYEGKNSDGGYPSDTYGVFQTAYEAAASCYDLTNQTAKNKNANQLEIDYRAKALSQAYNNMVAASNIDPTTMADGTYTIEVGLWKQNLTTPSMSNGALDGTATLIKKDGKYTLKLTFKPTLQYSLHGHLKDFYLYNGTNYTGSTANKNQDNGSGSNMNVKQEATYGNWYRAPDGLNSDTQTFCTACKTEGQTDCTCSPDGKTISDCGCGKNGTYNLPGTVTVDLPYIGTGTNTRAYWVGMNVDAMGGYANAVLMLAWSTLKSVDVVDTLSLNKEAVSLGAGLKTDTVTATVTGALYNTDDYTITCTGDVYAQDGTTKIATAKVSSNIITVTSESNVAGTGTITVTAAKAGQTTLTKHIAVTVSTGSGVSATTTASEGKTNTTISGDVIVTNETTVAPASTKVTIDAKAKTTGTTAVTASAVKIETNALTALANSDKSIEIQTDAGTVQLDAAAMDQILTNAKGESVVLTVAEGAPSTVVSGTVKVVVLTLEDSEGNTIAFTGGSALVSIPCTDPVEYAYCIEGNNIKERVNTSQTEGTESVVTWTTNHFSTWALSPTYVKLSKTDSSGAVVEDTGIKNGTYSVPVTVKKYDNKNLDSMANDAIVNNMVVAEVTDSKITYTLTMQSRIGNENGVGTQTGHLLHLWSFAEDDYKQTNPIPATVSSTYVDEALNGGTDTFPRTFVIERDRDDGDDPEDGFYIQVSVDAMGETNYQQALMIFDWDNAVRDGGSSASKGTETTDTTTTTDTISSGSSISSSKLEGYIDDGGVTVENANDSITAQFDKAALQAVADKAGSSSVKVTLTKADTKDLTAAQKTVIGSKTAYVLTVTCGDETITNFGTGKVTVTMPYTLGAEEQAEGLVVYCVADDGTVETLACTYNAAKKTVTFTTNHFSVYYVGYDASRIWTNPFTDVAADAWYYDAVRYAVQNNLFNGTSDTTFSPSNAMTRAMLVTVLYRLEGSPTVTAAASFTDVDAGTWYTDAVAWAAENGIVNGTTDTTFSPNSSITREQLATILYRYGEKKGYDVTATTDLSAFSDQGSVSDYAKTALQWAVAKGLVNGTTDTTLSPQGSATRAQVATILMRFAQQVVK